jgi:DNA-binding NtrC family response regulator
LRRLLDLAARIAATDEPVLLKGESGTGKEVIAHHIQRRSRRAPGPFIAVNCAAVSSTLLESELFGHEKGAFSGAVDRRIGFFEMADGGTIFLDEIGDMAPGMQAKLLRVLQSGEFWRVGGSRPLQTNVRVVAATNRDLEDLIRAGDFREDLHFRINTITLTIPPLRERREDIALLARHFLAEVPARASGTTFGAEALEALDAYAWPGNVRELRNVVRRAALLAEGPEIEVGDLMLPAAAPRPSPDLPQQAPDLSRPLEEVERDYILAVLSECGGNKAKAARVLGIAVKTIYNKLEAWGLGGPE